ncbi:flavin reductase family protein [Alicyclobacillus ferrooxydans]|uniref:Flavin reductase n=1 Tax=Alicyclobacillus ferrooxydans TaxID=471514 RepID=A0A0P9EX43_9BACL|nr:flavin reductase family protein [Alicyclobacillus ferrooxydans]KPV43692.1 flavin reductase [Alicyclobacillus ferrooxydans]
MPVTEEQFRHALGRFASGVTIVTTAYKDQLNGLTVSAFCSVSLNPPYILICVDKGSSANPAIQGAKAFAVNILTDAQSHLSNHFARRTDDKFSGVSYRLGQLGMPLLDDTLGYLECTIAQQVDAGDHYIYIGQVEHASVDSSAVPLMYYNGSYRQLTEK